MFYNLSIIALRLPSPRWRLIRSIIHFLLSICSVALFIGMAILINFSSLDKDDPFRFLEDRARDVINPFYFVTVCTIAQLFLGLSVLSSNELGARLFAPIISALVAALRIIATLRCFEKCQPDMNDFLDDVERVEGDEGATGGKDGVEEEGEEGEEEEE